MLRANRFWILAAIIFFRWCENVAAVGEVTQVDQLTSDYLMAEKDLWAVILKREDSTLQQMYNVHTHFLSLDLGGSNVLLNGTHVKSVATGELAGHIIQINQTSYDIAEEFFERRNYTVLSEKANRAINLTESFEAILNATIKSNDFLNDLAALSNNVDCHFDGRVILPVHQVEFDYYKDIQATALRTYITVQLAFMILHLHESGNFLEQAIQNHDKFREKNAEIRKMFKSRLHGTNREVWACDPHFYDEPGNNLEITNFLRGYIDNEGNLNADGSCALTCSDYHNTKQHQCRPDTFCASLNPEQRKKVECKGRIRGCYGLEDELSICVSDVIGERYKYVKSANGLKLGATTSCSGKEVQANAWIRWFVKCSNCFCLCDDETDSDRYISLREVVSNLERNRVITGLQLTKINRVIQFVTTESVLRANGVVDNLPDEPKLWKSGPLLNLADNTTKEGVDYHKLTFDHRSVNLDTIIAPIGQVVTGVRLQRNAAGHLHLEIRATDFDFVTGHLINLEKSVWLSNPAGGKHRINTDVSNISIKSPKPSVRNTKENAFIRFGPTHNRIDVSQRTVPFIDTQKILPKVSVPLAGIGLYYKGIPHYGGFLAPKLVIYDFEPYIQKN